jgi:uncharacterized phage protein (TIGR02218 family)
MKAASSDLEALLESDNFVDCDLYTFTLFDGTVLRYTTADVSIRVGANIWDATSVAIDDPNQRAVGHWKVGLDVDTWQVKIIPRTVDPVSGSVYPDKIGTTPWLAAAAAGALDGATLLVERAFLPAWPQPFQAPVVVTATGKLTIFLGRVAEVDIGGTFAIVNANDFRELLTTQMPRNVYQSGCRWTLFDSGCGLNAGTFVSSGTVAGGSTNQSIVPATLGGAAGTYSLGRIVMTSGRNAGFARTVRSWDGTTLKLMAPFYFDIAQGDTFDIYPGCDKQLATCTSKFNNAANFGGQPYIPAAETAV